MRDELEELTTDASARKKATDWLMQVISARKPINLQLNNSALEEDGDSAVAVAVADPVNEPKSVKWTGEFSAEDLCGAPAVPVVKAEPSAYTEVTADDVCWVPEEKRLRPEPVVAPAPKVLQMVQPGRESQPEPEIKQAEPPKSSVAPMAEGFFGKTALAAEPVMNHLSLNDGLSIDDITREPAPFVVKPIWNSFGGGFYPPDVDERPVTGADISRDWVVESMEPQGERGKDGVVLPFSFKVLKSKEEEAAAAATSEIVTEENHADPAVLEVEVKEAAVVEEVAEAWPVPEEVVVTAEAGLDSFDAAQTEDLTPVVEEALAEVAASPVEAEATEAEAVAPEADKTLAEAGESVLAEETQEEIATEAEGVQPESAFAHAGFWEDSVPGAVASEAHSGEEARSGDEKPLDMDVNRSIPAQPAADEGFDAKWPKEWIAAWKTLLRFGSALPWMARSLPALEAGATGEGVDTPVEMRQDIAGLRLVQYEIRTTVQDHTLHLKRMDEQLGRIREAMESRASDSAELVESVKAMTKLVRVVGAGLGGLLVVLVLLVGILLAHGH